MAGATTVFPGPAVALKPLARSSSEGAARKEYLHGPVMDFLLLGGASLLLLPFLLMLPGKQYQMPVSFWMLALANVINHPHFAHSYQIFYRGFGKKLLGPSLSKEMHVRYAVAGLLVPIILVAFFAFGFLTKDVWLIGFGGNIMALFVGWHYVKQGYGMLMVDAALKRRFFNDAEKKLLLVNAYAVWGVAWLFVNDAHHQKKLWGLSYFTFAVPSWLLALAGLVVAGTTIAALLMLWSKRREGKKLPWTGIMAYGVTLYLWILFVRINPIWLLVVPALHSMQYLAVVYRFQTNYVRARSQPGDTLRSAFASHRVQLTIFAMIGLFLGAALFWVLPNWFDARVAYDKALFSPTLFLFMFWVFVNVHHYFIDSVMWRRDNPETKLYLFG